MMKILFVCWLSFISLAVQANKVDLAPDNIYPKVLLETTMGKIVVELDRVKAPITVDNFLFHVVTGEYNNTVFHRVIPDFVVQGGGYDDVYAQKPIKGPIVNESGNGLKNEIGTIAMARQRSPHSATRQFFFNMGDNRSLDPGKGWGYTVFGSVVDGLEVLEKISKVKTDFEANMGWSDVPVDKVMIIKALLLKE